MLKGPQPCTIFCFHTLYMNNVVTLTKTFLLVSSSAWRDHCVLCMVKAKKSEQKPIAITAET